MVATDFPHARELLADGAGLVVPHSEEALAAAICHLLDDDEAYASATRRALHASDRLSWESVAEQYIGRSAHRGDAVA